MKDKTIKIRWLLAIFFSYVSTYKIIFDDTSALRTLGMSYFFISLFLYFFISKHFIHFSYFITNSFIKNKLIRYERETLFTVLLFPSIILLIGSVVSFTASQYFVHLSKSGKINSIRFLFMVPQLNIIIIFITLIIAFIMGLIVIKTILRKQFEGGKALLGSFTFNLALYLTFILLSYILSKIFLYITDLLIVATAFGFGVA